MGEGNPIDTQILDEVEPKDFASVEKISKEYNVFIVHKIITRAASDVEEGEYDTTFTRIKEGFTDPSLLAKVVVAMEPEISCSTIAEGDTVENFFHESHGVGFLLKGGNVTFAAASDAFTTFDEEGNKLQDRNARDVYQQSERDNEGSVPAALTPFASRMFGSVVNSPEDIAFAIRNRRKSTKDVYRYNFTPFNELTIKAPKVGGLFTVLQDYNAYSVGKGETNFDNYMREYDPETNSFLIANDEASQIDAARALGAELGIPDYIFYHDKFYHIAQIAMVGQTPDQYRDRRVYLDKPVTIDEVLSTKSPLENDPSKKDMFMKEIEEAKPFK